MSQNFDSPIERGFCGAKVEERDGELELPPLERWDKDAEAGAYSNAYRNPLRLDHHRHIGCRERQLRDALHENKLLKAKSVDSISPKIPWDMPTSDRQIYESISAKSPEERTVLEGIFKRYADLCFEAIQGSDALRKRAIKAEAELDSLSPSEPTE